MWESLINWIYSAEQGSIARKTEVYAQIHEDLNTGVTLHSWKTTIGRNPQK